MQRAQIKDRPSTPRAGIRRPVQKRSQIRFEAILDSAERLLDRLEPSEISVYTLADDAGFSPPSIYQFFSDSNQVFVALAERILGQFVTAFDQSPNAPFHTWQELMALRFGDARAFYNQNKAARSLLLGSGLSSAIRARDLNFDREIAMRSKEEIQKRFFVGDIPEIVERFTELLVINDALWTLSVHRHGIITDAYEEQARRAREAYSRTFLPEYLPIRQTESVSA